MRIDPAQTVMSAMYHFLISTLVPRPIAFVSTRGADGSTNLAPFSFFTAVSSQPPMIAISIMDRGDDAKDTLRNIRETKEFVVNIVTEPMLAAMVKTAGEWPRGTSEFGVSGLTELPSERVAAPAVKESPVQYECRLHSETALGNSFLVIGEVVLAHVADDVFTGDRVDPAKLAAVGRLGGELYAPLREVVKVQRPRVSRETGQPLD